MTEEITRKRRSYLAGGAALLAAGALAVGTMGPALADNDDDDDDDRRGAKHSQTHKSYDDDIEREGTYGYAEWDYSVDRERKGFEVSFDIDDARPGSKWKVVLKHDGKTYFNKTVTADRDGEIELEHLRPNTKGKDNFKASFRHLDGGATKTVLIKTR